MNVTMRNSGTESPPGRLGRILLVDNDPSSLQAWGAVLDSGGFEVIRAEGLNSAKEFLQSGKVQIIVTDLHLDRDADENDLSGLELVNAFGASLPVIVLTGLPTVDAVLKSIADKRGPSKAFDFIRKGKDGPARLLDAVEKAFGRFSQAVQVQTGGAITDENAASYVNRKVEEEIIQRLRNMEYLLIIEPRQQGKTSLVNFLLRNPLGSESVVVLFELTSLSDSSESEWYESLFEKLKDGVAPRIPELEWPAVPKSKSSWSAFLFALARSLHSLHRSLVVALDEVGYEFPGMAGFFTVLREIYNSRQAEPALRRLTFLLVGALDPRDLISVDKGSPFNVAQRVRLPDFSQSETEMFVRKIVSESGRTEALAERIYGWTSGQPYLTNLLCSSLRADSTVADVDKAVEAVKNKEELHFPSIREALNQLDHGWELVDRILKGDNIKFFPRDSSIQGKLELLGVVVSGPNGFCAIRNRLYRDNLSVFRQHQLAEEKSRRGKGGDSVTRLRERSPGERARIFVSHGHDELSRMTLVTYLKEGGADPVVFQEKARGGKAILDSLEEYSDVDFAIILVTPDDIGSKVGSSPRARARQNVVFELGFFIAKLGRSRVVILYKEDPTGLEWPSNYDGVLRREMKDDWKIIIAQDLAAAKIHLDILGSKGSS